MRWILILLTLVCSVALSQQPANNKPVAQQDQTAQQPRPVMDRQLIEYTGELSRFTKWLAFAIVILAAVAVWQGVHLKRTAASAEANARRQLRAYVGIEDVCFDWLTRDDPHSGYSHDLRLRFKNYGATPAILASVRWKRSAEAALVNNDTESLLEFGQMILPPGAGFGRPLGSAPGLGHKDRFFVYGRFSYGDIFQMWHTVRFCYVHHWTEPSRPEAVGTSVFTPYGEYNYETRHETQKEAMAAT